MDGVCFYRNCLSRRCGGCETDIFLYDGCMVCMDALRPPVHASSRPSRCVSSREPTTARVRKGMRSLCTVTDLNNVVSLRVLLLKLEYR